MLPVAQKEHPPLRIELGEGFRSIGQHGAELRDRPADRIEALIGSRSAKNDSAGYFEDTLSGQQQVTHPHSLLSSSPTSDGGLNLGEFATPGQYVGAETKVGGAAA